MSAPVSQDAGPARLALPSIDNLRCFDAAAHSPSFRAAARVVSLTPAALGQRIRQLEDQLGARLFERTTRSVSLTAAGLALVPVARAALESVAECLRAARGEHGPIPFELTLGTRYELGLSFVIPLHDTLRERHPGLTLHYYFGSGPDLLLRARSREVDCAITSTRFADPTLDSAQLHREDYVFVGSAELLRQTPFTRNEHAARHTLIDVGSELPLFKYWRDAPGGGDRLRFGRIWRVGLGEAVRRLVLEGRGVAVLPQYLVQADLDAGRLKRLFPSIKPLFDHFRLVFRANDPRRPIYEAMATTIREAPLR